MENAKLAMRKKVKIFIAKMEKVNFAINLVVLTHFSQIEQCYSWAMRTVIEVRVT
jgi:hypothetical protein